MGLSKEWENKTIKTIYTVLGEGKSQTKQGSRRPRNYQKPEKEPQGRGEGQENLISVGPPAGRGPGEWGKPCRDEKKGIGGVGGQGVLSWENHYRQRGTVEVQQQEKDRPGNYNMRLTRTWTLTRGAEFQGKVTKKEKKKSIGEIGKNRLPQERGRSCKKAFNEEDGGKPFFLTKHSGKDNSTH